MAKQFKAVYILLVVLFPWSAVQALTLDGVTEFASVFELNTAANGVVKRIHVSPGQRVSKDQILIELDTTPHAAELERARAKEKALLPDVEIAQLELERVQELYAIDSLSQVDLKSAENKLTRAEGVYQQARAEAIIASYHLEQTIIRSPVNGRVLAVYTNRGQYVDAGEDARTLITIVESSHMKATGMLSSDEWDPVLFNKAATITYRDQEYTGRVGYLGLLDSAASNGKPAYAIHIYFETNRLLPARMPVGIVIED